MMLFALLGGFIEALLVNIDEGDNGVVKSDALGVGLTLAVGADDGDTQLLACGVLSLEEKIRTGEGSGGEARRAAQEMTA